MRLFHPTLDNRLSEKIKWFLGRPLITVFIVMESRISLNFITKMKRWRDFTRDGLLEIVGHAYIFYCIYRRNLPQKYKTNKKNWGQTIKKMKNEFERFDVRPLHYICCFFLQLTAKQQEFTTALFYRITSCTIKHKLSSF